MLNALARSRLTRVLDPLGARLAHAGVSPDAVTLVGTVGTVAGALAFYPRGVFFVGTLVIWFFVMADMLDGAVARAGGRTSPWGAFLDSTLDRIGDAAVFATLAWYFAVRGHNPSLVAACLLCLVFASLTSYLKARAESLGLRCDVGLAERTERLVVALVGTGLSGLGVPYVQAGALWLLVVATAWTVAQRLVEVHRQASGRGQPVGQREPGTA